MLATVRSPAILAALAVALAACGDARPVAHGTEVDDCTRCHADPPATGAHAAHVNGGYAIGCTTCHGANAGGPGHFGSGQPIVQFTGLAVANGATPSYATGTQTCSGVYCHGAKLAGGTQPNPVWTGSLSGCSSCHASPPGFPHPAAQVAGTPPPPVCASCHGTTVDASGSIVRGGTHVNGHLDGGGHEPGFDQPAQHGRAFFAVAKDPAPNSCQACHGADYGDAIVPPVAAGQPNRSCTSCHEAAGWSGGWQANCSFCHGVRSAQTQAGPYDVGANPTWAAPPDAISQRLGGGPAADRTGAHAGHLTSAWATLACSVCHAVPTTISHIGGESVRATVVVTAPGKPSDANAYDATSQTCATYCHDPIGNGAARSPAWTATALACNGCHGVPPATVVHLGLTGLPANLGAECSGCHPNTITPAGTIDLAAGGHMNGTVDSPAGHAAGFYLPANHGSQFLNTLAGVPGSLSCASCHTGYASCSGCHANPAAQATPDKPELASYTTQWVSWRSNCTFCHGAKTAAYAAADLPLSAPPDDVAQRLAGGGPGNEVPSRTGQHSIHLLGGGFVPVGTGELPCSSCHAVPSAVDDAGHVTADRVASVAITAAGAFPGLSAGDLAKLPSPLVTYDRPSLTCTGYCHGSAAWGGNNTVMIWTDDFSTPIQGCNDCHGQPPPTGSLVKTALTNACPTTTFPNGCANHTYHSRIMNRTPYLYDSCANCHFGALQGTSYAGLHVNGKTDIVYTPAGTSGFKDFTATWDASTRTCTASCHTTSGTTTVQSW